MEGQRYIATKALKVDNELIPFWLLEYEENERWDSIYKEYKYNGKTYYQDLEDVIWDLKKKKVKDFIVKNIEIYPDKFLVDDIVLVESGSNAYRVDKVSDIIFETYDSIFEKGKNIEKYYLKYLSEINPNESYEIRSWKPIWVLKSGRKITWEHQLKTLIEDETEKNYRS